MGIFVLKLIDDKYFVGQTNNKAFTLSDFENKYEWTSIYSPTHLIEFIDDCNEYDIYIQVHKYMNLFGERNVRGEYNANVIEPFDHIARISTHQIQTTSIFNAHDKNGYLPDINFYEQGSNADATDATNSTPTIPTIYTQGTQKI
jgi:hypothetical protein